MCSAASHILHLIASYHATKLKADGTCGPSLVRQALELQDGGIDGNFDESDVRDVAAITFAGKYTL
jgi:hypothetical protein